MNQLVKLADTNGQEGLIPVGILLVGEGGLYYLPHTFETQPHQPKGRHALEGNPMDGVVTPELIDEIFR